MECNLITCNIKKTKGYFPNSTTKRKIPGLGCSLETGGGGGRGLPAIIDEGGVVFEDTIFLGSVLDLLEPFKLVVPLLRNELWLDEVLPIGESGIDPFLKPFLGGAIVDDLVEFLLDPLDLLLQRADILTP